jgi:transcriptional regulator of acetoin/glycerol metabolism
MMRHTPRSLVVLVARLNRAAPPALSDLDDGGCWTMTSSAVCDRALFRQREAFLSGEDPDGRARIRPEILASWRRSISCAVDPVSVEPECMDSFNANSRLTAAAVPVIDRAFEMIEPGTAALVLTDGDGTVVRRWYGAGPSGRTLGELYSRPGHSLSEASVGTNAIGIVRETERPIVMSGPEHFRQSFLSLLCAGSPIVHPVTSKLIGILDVTCPRTDSHAVLLPWVTGLAADIQRELLQRVSRHERLLLHEYVRASRGPGQVPVICLNDRTIIATPPAARIVNGVQQAFLWEHAARAISRARDETFELTLDDGASVTLRCQPIRDAGETVGAVVRFVDRPAPPPRQCPPSPAVARTGGSSVAWRHACEELDRGWKLGVPLLLRGEPGAGKLTLARAAHSGELSVIDAAAAGTGDFSAWITDLRAKLHTTDRVPLVLQHLTSLEPRQRRSVIGLIEQREAMSGLPLIVTETVGRESDASVSVATAELSCFVVTVPPLRDRFEDLPQLLSSLSESACGRPRRWQSDAVQALSRLDWPGNVRQLRNLVRAVLAAHPEGDIGIRQLPVELLADVPHRNLTRMERLEFNAIVAALRMFGGNKLDAAGYLQISRSTLYRKMHAFGLDLDRWAY